MRTEEGVRSDANLVARWADEYEQEIRSEGGNPSAFVDRLRDLAEEAPLDAAVRRAFPAFMERLAAADDPEA